jgi:hypothetical protein
VRGSLAGWPAVGDDVAAVDGATEDDVRLPSHGSMMAGARAVSAGREAIRGLALKIRREFCSALAPAKKTEWPGEC